MCRIIARLMAVTAGGKIALSWPYFETSNLRNQKLLHWNRKTLKLRSAKEHDCKQQLHLVVWPVSSVSHHQALRAGSQTAARPPYRQSHNFLLFPKSLIELITL